MFIKIIRIDKIQVQVNKEIPTEKQVDVENESKHWFF